MPCRHMRVFALVGSAIWMLACDSPASPDLAMGPFNLTGVVRDSFGRPIPDVRLEILDRRVALYAVSNADGRFAFVDQPAVAEPVTLYGLKPGYRPGTMQVPASRSASVTLAAAPGVLEGDFTISFTADSSCGALPASIRSRTYSATIADWNSTLALFTAVLNGSEFFSDQRRLWGLIRGNTTEFYISSYEAYDRWVEDIPIHERLSDGGFVSVIGKTTTPIPGSEPSFTTTFDGTMSFCSRATDSTGDRFGAQCTAPVIRCRSDRHQLTVSR